MDDLAQEHLSRFANECVADIAYQTSGIAHNYGKPANVVASMNSYSAYSVLTLNCDWFHLRILDMVFGENGNYETMGRFCPKSLSALYVGWLKACTAIRYDETIVHYKQLCGLNSMDKSPAFKTIIELVHHGRIEEPRSSRQISPTITTSNWQEMLILPKEIWELNRDHRLRLGGNLIDGDFLDVGTDWSINSDNDKAIRRYAMAAIRNLRESPAMWLMAMVLQTRGIACEHVCQRGTRP